VPDLIVMDLTMPVMNGLDAAKILLVQMPSIPIIMFSNTANAILEEDTQMVGIRALFSKAEGPGKSIEKAKQLLN
jgi:CheY-like chemotaxis protein